MARVSEGEREIVEGKAVVEDMVCAFCEARGMGNHHLEWGPVDHRDLQFPLCVTVGGPTSARVLKIPRALLQDCDIGALARLARNFVWQLTPDAP